MPPPAYCYKGARWMAPSPRLGHKSAKEAGGEEQGHAQDPAWSCSPQCRTEEACQGVAARCACRLGTGGQTAQQAEGLLPLPPPPSTAFPRRPTLGLTRRRRPFPASRPRTAGRPSRSPAAGEKPEACPRSLTPSGGPPGPRRRPASSLPAAGALSRAEPGGEERRQALRSRLLLRPPGRGHSRLGRPPQGGTGAGSASSRSPRLPAEASSAAGLAQSRE